jgi:putative PIN family toxin of toxin-antitoxin system
MRPLVLDTNIVLDLFVFRDESVRGLREQVEAGSATWLATAAMREELARVLAYENIAGRMEAVKVGAADVLAAFDRCVLLVDAPPAAAIACRDPDDQKFIDLAVARNAMLMSKDAHILRLRRKLAAAGVEVPQP